MANYNLRTDPVEAIINFLPPKEALKVLRIISINPATGRAFSQRGLSELMGIDKRTVVSIERGTRKPSPEMMERFRLIFSLFPVTSRIRNINDGKIELKESQTNRKTDKQTNRGE